MQIITHAAQYDPTRTLTLRRKFEQRLVGRFNKVKRAINEEVREKDGFGIKTNAGRFEFTTTAGKVAAFSQWLDELTSQNVLGVTLGTPVASAADRSWANVYIDSAYQSGMSHAASKLRGEGVEVDGGWITSSFFRPVHADRIGMIYTRTFTDLRGITQAMDQRISRELALGLAEGRNPLAIARSLNEVVDTIGITRARTLARTEVINAHADATLNAYEEAGIEGVSVEAEWLTARDSKVCERCDSAARRGPYSINDARGLIPLHPNCRCAWAPVVVDPKAVRLS